jgi:hypothetical protein
VVLGVLVGRAPRLSQTLIGTGALIGAAYGLFVGWLFSLFEGCSGDLAACNPGRETAIAIAYALIHLGLIVTINGTSCSRAPVQRTDG